MVSSSCMYRSSPPPPSTSWSSFRMISFSNCRRDKKKKRSKRWWKNWMDREYKRGRFMQARIPYSQSVLLFYAVSQEAEHDCLCVSVCVFVASSAHRVPTGILCYLYVLTHFCMEVLPCESFLNVHVHKWSCQRRWGWWLFSVPLQGSVSSPGLDPLCQVWNRSCGCLKNKS